jgi:NTE family protein
MMKRQQEIAAAAQRLSDRLPPDLRDDPDLTFLKGQACPRALALVHFIYKSKHALSFSKDYEFSRVSIEAHWAAGVADATTTLADPRWINRKRPERGTIQVLDLSSPIVAAAAQKAVKDRQ